MAQPSAAADPAVPSAELRELREHAAKAMQQSAAENFPVALRVLPARVRDDLARVYCFARFVDDVGDEATGDRLALLRLIEADLSRLTTAPVLEPVRGLLPLISAGRLDVEPLRALVAANLQDQVQAEYETFDDLLAYCRLSAAPIGHIILQLAGVRDELAIQRSDHVCAALQILEHCQDVGEDARAGRIYLPAVDRRHAGLRDAELLARHTSPAVRRVVAEQVARANLLLTDGLALTRGLRGWARPAVAGYVAGGRATARALEKSRYDVLGQSVRPGKAATAGYAALVLAGR